MSLLILQVDPFFSAFDENQDGHIDFKELSCGVSAACRGPEMERQKCKLARIKPPPPPIVFISRKKMMSHNGCPPFFSPL